MKETKTIDDLNKFMSKKEQAFAKEILTEIVKYRGHIDANEAKTSVTTTIIINFSNLLYPIIHTEKELYVVLPLIFNEIEEDLKRKYAERSENNGENKDQKDEGKGTDD